MFNILPFHITLRGAAAPRVRDKLYSPTSAVRRRIFDRAVAVQKGFGGKVLVFNAAIGQWVSPSIDTTLRRLGCDGVLGELDPPIRNGLRATI